MMLLTIAEEENCLILTQKESKIKSPSLENGKYLLKCCNTNLYKEGDLLTHILYLIHGKVLIYKEDKYGKSQKLSQVNNGTFLGLDAYYGTSKASHSATARGNIILLVIPKFQFKDLLNRWGNIKTQIISQLINQLDSSEIKFHNRTFFY